MRLSAEEEQEREVIFARARAARSREQIARIREDLRLWKAEHPDDVGLPGAFGDLKMTELALDARDAEDAAKTEQAA